MGYYVSGSGDVRIAKEKLEDAYEALMKLNDVPDDKKNGGSFSGGGRTASWFSWMPQDLTTIPDARAVFDLLGFETQYEDDGGLLVMSYDNKTGQEGVFFAAAAPFITDESEFYWTGEDGIQYKWEFRDGKMMWLDGQTVYTHARPYGLEQALREYA